ncbi:MAG: hypothetical protein Q8Q17_01890 [bacterium]|nr:hypothetical protein [bacterium]
MNTLQRFAVAVLVAASVLFGGCVSMLADPNRPPAQQPEVPVEVQRGLALKQVQEIPVYVSSRVIYYDASRYIEWADEVHKMTPEEKKKQLWTDAFPKVLDPPRGSLLVADAAKVVAEVKAIIKNKGFGLVEIPCQQCLIVLLDYAEHWQIRKVIQGEQKTLYTFVRARLYYDGQEIAIGQSDAGSSRWMEGIIKVRGNSMEDAFRIGAEVALNHTFKALNYNIASWRQQLSAVQ